MESLCYNPDIIEEISGWIFASSYLDINGNKINRPEKIIHNYGASIQKLSCVNRFYNKMFSNEQLGKIIIDICHKKFNLTHSEILENLNPKGGIFLQIKNKIYRLFDIVFTINKNFTDNDLEDTWFLNTTILIDYNDLKKKLLLHKKPKKEKDDEYCFRSVIYSEIVISLLHIVVITKNLDKIEKLVKAGSFIDNDFLVNIVRSRVKYLEPVVNNELTIYFPEYEEEIKKKYKNKRTLYLNIAKILLKYGSKITKCDNNYPTALMIAVYHNDIEYASMLLKHKIDLYEKCYASDEQLRKRFGWQTEEQRDVFEIGKNKPWFNDMLIQFDIKH